MTTEYCPGTDYQSPHQTLLDHVNGCVVCTSCSRVLEEGLSYNELYSKKALEQKPKIGCPRTPPATPPGNDAQCPCLSSMSLLH